MSNLHGILNNLVNELTESSALPSLGGVNPDALTSGVTQMSREQMNNPYSPVPPADDAEYMRQVEARSAESRAMHNLAMQHALGQRTQSDLDMDRYVANQQAEHEQMVDKLTDPGLLARMKSEVATHPWLYGGLGAAALASGAGALALRKRLAKTKNQ